MWHGYVSRITYFNMLRSCVLSLGTCSCLRGSVNVVQTRLDGNGYGGC